MGHDPTKSDLEIIAYLYDYLEWLQQQPNLEEWSDGFFHELQIRIAQVDSNIRSAVAEEREALIGYFHEYLLIATVKAVKISVMCAICKSACGKLSLKFQEGISLDKTVKYVHSLQGLVLELFKNLQHLDLHKQFNNDAELYLKKSMAHKLVQHLLQDCDELVTRCAVCVRDKTKSESLFFNIVSCSVAALGVGRLVYSVYRNVSLDEMVQTGLWVACAGATAAVLHLPRIALEETTALLAYHESQCVTMMSMMKPWLRNVPHSGGCNGLNSPILTRPPHAHL